MNLEKFVFGPKKEVEPKTKVDIEVGYENFVPQDFLQNPVEYFESKGKNIKSGEIKRNIIGQVRDDPTAVKELPIWKDGLGHELKTVGKRVDAKKGKVGESGNPFYEYKIMEAVAEIGLPTPKPIAKVEQDDTHLIIMEKVSGIAWHEKDITNLQEHGFSDDEIKQLEQRAEVLMNQLQVKFEEAGIRRGWKLKDMILDVDMENKTICNITPVDWERTKIDQEKLEIYKARQIKM